MVAPIHALAACPSAVKTDVGVAKVLQGHELAPCTEWTLLVDGVHRCIHCCLICLMLKGNP